MLESLKQHFSVYEIRESLEKIMCLHDEFLYEKSDDSPAHYYLELVGDLAEYANILWSEIGSIASDSWQFPNTVFSDNDYVHKVSWINAFLTMFDTSETASLLDALEPIAEDEYFNTIDEWDIAAQSKWHSLAVQRLTKEQIVSYVPKIFDYLCELFDLRCSYDIINETVNQIEKHGEKYQRLGES